MFANESVKIIPYRQELSVHFSRLNAAWLQQYFAIEPIDEEMLANPQQYYIDKGGYIFFAETESTIVGTFALLKVTDGIFELSKMAVDQNYQGKRIGNQMMEFCVDYSRQLNLEKLILFSNTILTPAIHLYKKYGFLQVPVTQSGYSRSDIKMELHLKQ